MSDGSFTDLNTYDQFTWNRKVGMKSFDLTLGQPMYRSKNLTNMLEDVSWNLRKIELATAKTYENYWLKPFLKCEQIYSTGLSKKNSCVLYRLTFLKSMSHLECHFVMESRIVKQERIVIYKVGRNHG